MDTHGIVEVLLGLIAFFGGMFVKSLADSIKLLHQQDKELTDKIHAIKELVAGDYVRRDDFDRKIDKLFEKLDLIMERIDSKVSHDELDNLQIKCRLGATQ